MDGQSQIDISKLSATDRKELNQFLTNEAQKSNIQQSKHYQYLRLLYWAFALKFIISCPDLHRSLLACCFFSCYSLISAWQPSADFPSTHSCAPSRRRLLEKVHYREDLFRPARSGGRGVRAELCGKVDGCELGSVEAFGDAPRAVNWSLWAHKLLWKGISYLLGPELSQWMHDKGNEVLSIGTLVSPWLRVNYGNSAKTCIFR